MIERQIGTNEDLVMLLTSFPDAEKARQIVTIWVESQLAACVNLLPGVESIYRWEGRTECAAEVLAIVKTTRDRVDAHAASLHELHPYDLPECLLLSPESGSAEYLRWVLGETTLDKSPS